MSKTTEKDKPSENGTLVHLDPDEILVNDNSRFNLKKYRIERLASEILNDGGVNTPVEVEPIDPDSNGGHKWKLTVGFYRQAAVKFLNDNSGAGLTLPAMVYSTTDPAVRLKRQLSENMERENQSPMDKAVAIKRLKEAGASIMDIRKIFSVPGGRKGLSIQPASNSFINMTLSFLELPKAIQEKIHDGRVGVGAAYQLTKVPAEKRQEVLDRAEEERIALIDKEEKEEAKFLEAEKKVSESQQKVETVQKELDTVKTTAAEAAKAAEEKLAAAAEAYKASKAKGLDEENRKKAQDHFKSAEAEAISAQKAAEKTAKEQEKLETKAKEAAAKAKENADKLAAARAAAGAKKGGQVGGKKGAVAGVDVKRAAAKVPGAAPESQYVALSATEIRKTVADWCLPGAYAKVQEIAQAINDCFIGKTTPPQAYTAMAKITEEYKGKSMPAAKK